MPDPQPKSEIMDVLSSIRRLVSEGRNVSAKPESDDNTETAQASAPSATPEDGRLMLTPALRVARPTREAGEGTVAADKLNGDEAEGADPQARMAQDWARDAAAETAESGDGDQAEGVDDSMAPASLEDTIAELEAAVAEIESGFEPDGGDAETMPGEQLSDAIWDDEPAADAALSGATGEVAADEAVTEITVVDEGAVENSLADETLPEEPLAKEVDAAEPAKIDVQAARPTPGFHGIMAGFDVLADKEDRLDAPITADAAPDGPPPPPGDYGRSPPLSGPAARHATDDFQSSLFKRARSGDLGQVPLAEFIVPRSSETLGEDSDDAALHVDAAHDVETSADDSAIATNAAESAIRDADAQLGETLDPDASAGLSAEAAQETNVPNEDETSRPASSATEADVTAEEADHDGSSRGEPQVDLPGGVSQAAPHGKNRLNLGSLPGTRPLIYRQGATGAEDGDLTRDSDDNNGPDAAETGDTDLFDPLSSTDIDLEVLRDVVAEVIREELRGTLGERITRNLRLLVRREIARALDSERADDPLK